MTQKHRIFLMLLLGVSVACALALLVASTRSDQAEGLLDEAGCHAAQRFGVTVSINGGMCVVAIERIAFLSLILDGGVRISRDHVLGWRSVP